MSHSISHVVVAIPKFVSCQNKKKCATQSQNQCRHVHRWREIGSVGKRSVVGPTGTPIVIPTSDIDTICTARPDIVRGLRDHVCGAAYCEGHEELEENRNELGHYHQPGLATKGGGEQAVTMGTVRGLCFEHLSAEFSGAGQREQRAYVRHLLEEVLDP
jgi:hypothetical protein